MLTPTSAGLELPNGLFVRSGMVNYIKIASPQNRCAEIRKINEKKEKNKAGTGDTAATIQPCIDPGCQLKSRPPSELRRTVTSSTRGSPTRLRTLSCTIAQWWGTKSTIIQNPPSNRKDPTTEAAELFVNATREKKKKKQNNRSSNLTLHPTYSTLR